jgi:hypothetical protein
MENNSKLKLYVFVGLFIIIIGVIYLTYLSSKPKVVFTPDNYPVGTVISLYERVPPMFPREIILEDKELKYSGVVAKPDGKEQITVSYVSDKEAEDLVYLYNNTLKKEGWDVRVKDLRHSNYLLTSTKAEDTVMLTISLNRESKPLLTFQYEK